MQPKENMSHSAQPNSCQGCIKAFSSEFIVICRTCGAAMTSRRALVEHNHQSGPPSSSSSSLAPPSSAAKMAATGPIRTGTSRKRTLKKVGIASRGSKRIELIDLEDDSNDDDDDDDDSDDEEEDNYNDDDDHDGDFFEDQENLKTHRNETLYIEERVPCSLCDKTFKSKVILVVHLRKVHKEGPESAQQPMVFRCCKCDQRVEDRAALERHLLDSHPETTASEVRKCLHCDYSAKCKSLCRHLQKEHLDPSSKRLVYCEVCGKGLANADLLGRHKELVHVMAGVKPYKCAKCPVMFNTRRNATSHCRKVHGDADGPTQCPRCPFTGWPRRMVAHMKTSHKDLSCKQCDEVFDKERSLRSHVSVAHSEKEKKRKKSELKCLYCEDFKSVNRDELKEHVDDLHKDQIKKQKVAAAETAETEVCTVCDKSVRVGQLRRHFAAAHARKEECAFECHKCHKCFRDEQILDQHIMKNNQACPTCGKSCLTQVTLERHVNFKHRRCRFRCEQCGKLYTTSLSLKRHLQTAHGEGGGGGEKKTKVVTEKKKTKEYSCTYCDYKNASRDLVRDHVTAAHKDKAKNKLLPAVGTTRVCRVCSKNVRKGNMARHLTMLHPAIAQEGSVFECRTCKKGFLRESMLLKHLEVVHGRDLVVAHREIAAAASAFECVRCGEGFAQELVLLRHMELAHGYVEEEEDSDDDED